MALKRQFPPLATFSMSSMTDVIFLLLIFFVVTSTVIFPAALEVNLPQSSEQTDLKPVTEVYIDSLANIYLLADRTDSINTDPVPVKREELAEQLLYIHSKDSTRAVALYADKSIKYENVVEVLDIAARNDIKMVLATRSSQQNSNRQSKAVSPEATQQPTANIPVVDEEASR